MRWVATIVAIAASVVQAQAQTDPSAAGTALSAFNRICLETHANRASAVERLRSDGWTEATIAELPRSRRTRRGPVRVHIEGEPPANSIVYVGRFRADRLMVAHLATYDRVERGEPNRTATCSLYAIGATAEELATLLFPEEANQRSFAAAPLGFSQLNGNRFVTGVSQAATEGPYIGTFAFFVRDEVAPEEKEETQ